ncbi:MAG TPA: glycosyltransferase [Baekduia sp.]|uniref:glycosyltransferase n=1 Tax=Baekduia sp. TaxID=2600305 RepID=UPI002D76BAF1|nr:glycosyltransferase [Baekduia sp.]HET6508894.1 glycosyltransferase [Baekduia sp.]
MTLGVATYARDTYLHEAVASCLAQDYEDLEVLVVVDGSVNPRIDEVLATFDDPRLRVVRHEVNRGIAEAYNTIVREGRGELIAMLGDDDVCCPDRISRSVAVFDAHPDTGVVHGGATIIDGDGREHGQLGAPALSGSALFSMLWRDHNYLLDPTRMVHRRVYDACGGYHRDWTLAQDFHFWVRAAARFPFRAVEGAPLIRLRRHEENFSHADNHHLEVDQVEGALWESLEREPLAAIVPEVDWDLLHPLEAERQALELLAGILERRTLPLPGMAARVRARAAALAPAPEPARTKGKLLMTAFGWNDSGGGTMLPRFAARELVNRGWDVTVFYAAVEPDPSGVPYAISERDDAGVRLIGVHNRPHGLLDHGHPERELDDAPITAAFADVMDRVRPDVVHFHNLHNLGAALLDVAAARGVPSYFTTHNYWLVCPRAYLLRGDNSLCGGPGDAGADCATCLGGAAAGQGDAYAARLASIRDSFSRSITACLAVSHGVRRTLVDQGYPADALDVVRQSVPAEERAWELVGRDRVPGRVRSDALTVGFFGSVYAHKGAQLLVAAAQRADAPVRIQIHGEVSPAMARNLRALDRRGVVEVVGRFAPSELPDRLARVDVAALPSLWWDCAPLMAAECLAGRVPLLAPRMGGLAEAIREGVDGLGFDGGDADGLARAIERLAHEDGLLESLQAGIEAPRGFGSYVDELERYYGGERPSRVGEEPAAAVAWVGEHDAPTSLARINRRVVGELAADASVVAHAVATDRPDRAPVPLPHAADVEVRHQWPPDFTPPRSGHLALIQPWEFGSVPTAWVDPLNTVVDELWVPSAFVRDMYVSNGVDADRVHVVPNGVDLEAYAPAGPTLADLPAARGTRFLFVGGAIGRKGIDVLLSAWREAFPAGREDVELVVKDFGADGVYRGGDRSELERLAAEDGRVTHLTRTLTDDEVAALYRAADVLVHPYRGEGFAMPVLEAMACGRPAIVTAGGPTDEFCPEEAGWRIPSRRALIPGREISGMPLAGDGWMLEPDRDALVALLRAAADAGPDERARRGAAARAAAERHGWDAVAAAYARRIAAVRERAPRIARTPAVDVGLGERVTGKRLLAIPAYRGSDRLADLLAAWATAAPSGTPGTLVLVADPARDGAPEDVEGHIVAAAAAAGVDLDACADIEVRFLHATPGRDAALHAAVDGFATLHGASAGHARRARAAGKPVVEPDAASVAAFLSATDRSHALATA